MKMIYCAHKYGGDANNVRRAAAITKALQLSGTEQIYICPLLAFSEIGYNEMGRDVEMKLCLSLLNKCDELLVLSELSAGVRDEIEFASAHDIPIRFYVPKKSGGNEAI